MTQKAIVEIAVLRGIDSYKGASPLVFKNCFNDNLFLFLAQLKPLMKILFLNPVQIGYIFKLIIDFLNYKLSLILLSFTHWLFWLIVVLEFWFDKTY